jgi:hypothetical protein
MITVTCSKYNTSTRSWIQKSSLYPTPGADAPAPAQPPSYESSYDILGHLVKPFFLYMGRAPPPDMDRRIRRRGQTRIYILVRRG